MSFIQQTILKINILNSKIIANLLSRFNNTPYQLNSIRNATNSVLSLANRLQAPVLGGQYLDYSTEANNFPNFSIQKLFFHLSRVRNGEIGYTDFVKLKNSGLVVIDVREKSEIEASGTIPGSLNIPSKQISAAFTKSSKDFQALYGTKKPSEGQTLMFLCQRGVRSRSAMEKATQLGYRNAVSFRGGWEEFSQHVKK